MLISVLALSIVASHALAWSIAAHESLAGRSDAEIAEFARHFPTPGSSPLPEPVQDLSSKLVDTPAHRFHPPLPGQLRGPCPAVNTMANHGYIDRSGVDTPQNYVLGAMKAFNVAFDLSIFVTYANFLLNGNHLTNLMSAGHLTSLTGPPPPPPATAAGISTHGTFEGDASLTRLDLHFGSNVDFNERLFERFLQTSHSVSGNQTITVAAMGQYRFQRVNESRDTNPDFFFDLPRFPVAYSESGFAMAFFVDGRGPELQMPFEAARSFFGPNKMPNGFHSRNGGFGVADLGVVVNQFLDQHPVDVGANVKDANGTFHFQPNPNFMGGETDINCAVYRKFVNNTVALYPNPTGRLRKSLAQNVDSFFSAVVSAPCTKVFPFGKFDF